MQDLQKHTPRYNLAKREASKGLVAVHIFGQVQLPPQTCVSGSASRVHATIKHATMTLSKYHRLIFRMSRRREQIECLPAKPPARGGSRVFHQLSQAFECHSRQSPSIFSIAASQEVACECIQEPDAQIQIRGTHDLLFVGSGDSKQDGDGEEVRR